MFSKSTVGADKDAEHKELPEYKEAIRKLYQKSKISKYEDHWITLRSLYDRPYWRRVWIIQEIAFTSKVVVRIGSRHTT